MFGKSWNRDICSAGNVQNISARITPVRKGEQRHLNLHCQLRTTGLHQEKHNDDDAADPD